MSESKKIRARMQNKHKIESDWRLDVYDERGRLRENPFIPLDGELIIFDEDKNYSHKRFKFGDGFTNVMALPFIPDFATQKTFTTKTIQNSQCYDEIIATIQADNVYLKNNKGAGIYIDSNNVITIDNHVYNNGYHSEPVEIYEDNSLTYVATRKWVEKEISQLVNNNSKTFFVKELSSSECYSEFMACVEADSVWLKSNKDVGIYINSKGVITIDNHANYRVYGTYYSYTEPVEIYEDSSLTYVATRKWVEKEMAQLSNNLGEAFFVKQYQSDECYDEFRAYVEADSVSFYNKKGAGIYIDKNGVITIDNYVRYEYDIYYSSYTEPVQIYEDGVITYVASQKWVDDTRFVARLQTSQINNHNQSSFDSDKNVSTFYISLINEYDNCEDDAYATISLPSSYTFYLSSRSVSNDIISKSGNYINIKYKGTDSKPYGGVVIVKIYRLDFEYDYHYLIDWEIQEI